MKEILNCLSSVGHLTLAIVFALSLISGLAVAQQQEDFTYLATQWSQTRDSEQLEAISHELVSAIEASEQFVSLDGLTGIFAITENWMAPDQEGDMALIVNIKRVVDGGVEGSVIQFGIPKVMQGPADYLQPVEISIQPAMTKH
jgi:hypothetical protein